MPRSPVPDQRAAADIRAARERALEDALSALSTGERQALGELHEKLLAGLTGDRASAPSAASAIPRRAATSAAPAR